MNDRSIRGEARSVAGAVPASLRRVPANDTAQMGTEWREPVGGAVVGTPDGDLALVRLHDRPLAGRQFLRLRMGQAVTEEPPGHVRVLPGEGGHGLQVEP